MIAANYTTHLYCDCADCTERARQGYTLNDMGEYIGKSWSDTARQARKDGWRISADRTRAYAPGHRIPRPAAGTEKDADGKEVR